MGAMGILCILAAIISCTLAQDPTPKNLLRNANYYQTAGQNYDMYSWIPEAPGYKPLIGSSRYPSFYPSLYPRGHRHAANPESYSSQVVSENLLRNANYYPTAGPYWDISSWPPGQVPVYKQGFGSSRVSRQASSYPSSYPKGYRYATNPELYSYQWINMNERTNDLIKAAEQTNNKLEELHSKMMQYFDKEKIILRALVETTTTTKDNLEEE